MASDQTFYRNLSMTGHIKENLKEILQAWLDEIIEKELHRREVSALNEILDSKTAPMVVTLDSDTYRKFAGIAKKRGFDFFAREVKDSDRIAVIFSQRVLEQYRACAKDAMAYSRAYTEEDLDNIAVANGYTGKKTVFRNVNRYVAQSIENQLMTNGRLDNVVIQDNPDDPRYKNIICLKESETFLAKAISDTEFRMLGTSGKKEVSLQQYIEENRYQINQHLKEIENGERTDFYIASATKPSICIHITKDSFEILHNGEHTKGGTFYRQDKTVEVINENGEPVKENYRDIWYEERLREKINSIRNPVIVPEKVLNLGIGTDEYKKAIFGLVYKSEMSRQDVALIKEWINFKKYIDEKSEASKAEDYLSINDNIGMFLLNSYIAEKKCSEAVAARLKEELNETLPVLKNKENHVSIERMKPAPHSLEEMIKKAEKEAEMEEMDKDQESKEIFE